MGLKKIIGIVAVLALNTSAMAAEPIYVGGLVGAAIPTATGADTQFTFGGEAGYKFGGNMAAGVYFTTASQTVLDPISMRTSILTGFFDYYVMPEVYVGAMAGLVMSSTSGAGAADVSDSNFGAGARVGYDYSIMDNLSVGPQANVMFTFVEGSDPVINALAAIKYHF